MPVRYRLKCSSAEICLLFSSRLDRGHGLGWRTTEVKCLFLASCQGCLLSAWHHCCDLDHLAKAVFVRLLHGEVRWFFSFVYTVVVGRKSLEEGGVMFCLLEGVDYSMHELVIRPYLWGPKTHSGYLKPQIVPNPTCAMVFGMYTYLW